MSETTVLRVLGALDRSRYIPLRDKTIEAALNEPSAVVVDVTEMDVPEESAWSAVSSARWLVSRWPQIPIALVCRCAAGRLECDGAAVTVAVQDSSTALATLREGARRYGAPSGLRIVSALWADVGKRSHAVRQDGVGGDRSEQPALTPVHDQLLLLERRSARRRVSG
ncbi:hypothetical protein [Mycobacterium sp.]|uniref:hypothetical protein n=1 Tax=Mycobacterium sp. TaxID=1785 RepID=UPI0039C934C2